MTAPAYTRAAAAAIEQAARAEHDFGGWLAVVLATVAASLGSSDALTAGRPGSWEASLVDRLVKGTVGWSDEHLLEYAQAEESAADPVPPGLTAEQLELLASALKDAADHREALGADGYCADCENNAAGLCPDHEADFDRSDAYLVLARDLGIELED